jgi:hypothetical protein
MCFEGFIRFACREESLATFLVRREQQGLKVPAEELDKVLSYEKHYVCMILTHHGQVLVSLMDEFR